MKDFQEYTTFITGAGSSIELDVEQALLDEVAGVTPVNVAEETLKADMDDLPNTRKKITDAIYYIADTTIIQEATQQTIDRFGDEQIDYEIAGINASVQSPSWTHSLTHPKTEVITKLRFCDIHGAYGAIEG